jgi:hypothetical protein
MTEMEPHLTGTRTVSWFTRAWCRCNGRKPGGFHGSGWFRGICHELVGFTNKTKGFYLVHIKFCTELCRICRSTYWMHPISFGKTGVLLVVASRPSFTCCLFFWVKSPSSWREYRPFLQNSRFLQVLLAKSYVLKSYMIQTMSKHQCWVKWHVFLVQPSFSKW